MMRYINRHYLSIGSGETLCHANPAQMSRLEYELNRNKLQEVEEEKDFGNYLL